MRAYFYTNGHAHNVFPSQTCGRIHQPCTGTCGISVLFTVSEREQTFGHLSGTWFPCCWFFLVCSSTLTPPSSFKLTSSHLSCFLVEHLSTCCLSFHHGVISSGVIVSTCSTCLFVCSLGHASSHFTVAWLPPPPISLCDEAVTLNA